MLKTQFKKGKRWISEWWQNACVQTVDKRRCLTHACLIPSSSFSHLRFGFQLSLTNWFQEGRMNMCPTWHEAAYNQQAIKFTSHVKGSRHVHLFLMRGDSSGSCRYRYLATWAERQRWGTQEILMFASKEACLRRLMADRCGLEELSRRWSHFTKRRLMTAPYKEWVSHMILPRSAVSLLCTVYIRLQFWVVLSVPKPVAGCVPVTRSCGREN